MLIEFGVENFRSIGEKQYLYLQPDNTSNKEHFLIPTGDSRLEYLLPCITILGPNASGKSSLINSLAFFDEFIKKSATNKKDQLLPEVRFKLNPTWLGKPTHFTISFFTKEKFYEYQLLFTPNGISKEKLVYRKKAKHSKSITLIDRSNKDCTLHKDIYPQNPTFLDLWKVDVNNKQTFLAYLANKGGVDIFAPIIEWFNNFNLINRRFPDVLTSRMLADGRLDKNKLKNLLKSADLHFEDVTVITKQQTFPDTIRNLVLSEISTKTGKHRDEIETDLTNAQSLQIKTAHRDTNGDIITFDFEEEESEGTQKLYALAGPVIDTLQNGRLLIVDELERSLHPYLVRKLVHLFTSPDTNPNGAQLIFTTHDITVMDKSLLRPDEIYFTEKSRDNYETSLFCLADFDDANVKKNDRGEKLYKDYLDGRFDAVPSIEW